MAEKLEEIEKTRKTTSKEANLDPQPSLQPVVAQHPGPLPVAVVEAACLFEGNVSTLTTEDGAEDRDTARGATTTTPTSQTSSIGSSRKRGEWASASPCRQVQGW